MASLQQQLQSAREERTQYELQTTKQTLVLEKRIAKLTQERERLTEQLHAKAVALGEYRAHLEELQRAKLEKETEAHRGNVAELFHKLVSRTKEYSKDQRDVDEDIVVALSRRLEKVEGERLEMKEKLEKLGVRVIDSSASAPGSRPHSGRTSRSNSLFSSTQPLVANHNIAAAFASAGSAAGGALPAAAAVTGYSTPMKKKSSPQATPTATPRTAALTSSSSSSLSSAASATPVQRTPASAGTGGGGAPTSTPSGMKTTSSKKRASLTRATPSKTPASTPAK